MEGGAFLNSFHMAALQHQLLHKASRSTIKASAFLHPNKKPRVPLPPFKSTKMLIIFENK